VGYPALFVDQAYSDDRGRTSIIPGWVRTFGDQVFHHVAVRVEDIEQAMERLIIPPTKAREMYQQWPILKACPISHMFSFIRHDGKISLCACVADRRITLGNYLDLSQDERIVKRHDHSICQQCLSHRLSYYFHLVGDQKEWTPVLT